MVRSWPHGYSFPSLVTLRGEINRIAPNRDKTTDGSIGDDAHRNTNSDHNADEESDALRDRDADSKNEVHAIDVDKDLRVPGLTMQDVVDHLVTEHRAGRDNRLTYIIYDRKIYSSATDWRASGRAYTGANPHTAHAHFSASYNTSREADTSPYGLEDLVALTDEEIERIATRVEARVWNHTEPNPYDNGATSRRMGGDLRMMEYRDDVRAQATNITRLDGQVIPALARIEARQVAAEGRDYTDEPAIVAGVLAGLSPEAIAAAIPSDLAERVIDALHRRTAPSATPSNDA